jgi:flagellar biosynthesis anti-sigma factor FlgM
VNIDPNLNVTSGDLTERLQNPAGTQSPSAAIRPGTSAVATEADNAQISAQAQSASRLSAALANVPEIRADRVQNLQTAIQQGTYNPGNQQIAQSLLSDMVGIRATAE